MSRRIKKNGTMQKVSLDKNKKYKYSGTGDLVESTGTLGDNEISMSGSKSSLRRVADMERNISILATTMLTTDAGVGVDSPAQVKAAAASDATSKANAALASAKTYADQAEADAESAAATDATTKANNAKSQAIASAATDATTKANNAKSQAISAAATDATTKANAAKAAAIAAVTNGAGAAFDTLVEIQNAMATDSELSSAISSVTSSATATASADATSKANAALVSALEADQTPSQLLSSIKTVDGSGSGLDADLLDGIQGASLLRSDVSDVYNGRTLSFGTVGNGTNTSAAFLTIEGNTDGSGEGTGRLFFREHNSSTAAADNYGMSLGYRGGATSVTTAMGNTWTGPAAIGNGEWGMWGHDGNATGVLAMHGPRSGAYVDFTNALISGNQVWHAGNDGSGSGLDADLLDGKQTSATGGANKILASSANGYLYINNWIHPANGTGLFYDAGVHFHESGNNMYSNTGLSSANQGYLWGAANDGAGSGLDADLLDGQQGSSYLLKSGGTMTGALILDSGTSTLLNVRCDNGGNAIVRAGGQSQGTGAFEVSQDDGSHGGGMSYNGDGTPTFVSGETADHVTFYRIAAGARSEVFHYAYSSDTVSFNGSITASGDITAYSDARIKENIKVIPNALDKVQAIRGVTFTRNDTDLPDEVYSGVIAQEVEAVLPEVVSENEDGIKNVAYGNMVGLLIEAIKEQQGQIDEQKVLMAEQQVQIDELKANR